MADQINAKLFQLLNNENILHEGLWPVNTHKSIQGGFGTHPYNSIAGINAIPIEISKKKIS